MKDLLKLWYSLTTPEIMDRIKILPDNELVDFYYYCYAHFKNTFSFRPFYQYTTLLVRERGLIK
jgi:hypothetical protein